MSQNSLKRWVTSELSYVSYPHIVHDCVSSSSSFLHYINKTFFIYVKLCFQLEGEDH